MNTLFTKVAHPLLVGSLSVAMIASAQGAGNDVGSIQNLFNKALNYDAKFKAAQATLEAKQTIGAKSRAIVLPQLTLSANTTLNDLSTDRETSPATATPSPFDIDAIFNDDLRYNSNAVTLSLVQPISFQSVYLLSQAGALKQQAQLEYQLAEQDLILRVGKVYLEYLIVQDELKLAIAERDAIEEQKNKARAAFEVGSASVTDKHEAQAAFDLIQARLVAVEAQLENKYNEISDLMGESPGTIASYDGELDLDASALQIPETDKLIEIARQANSQLNLARIGHYVAKKEVARLRTHRLPSFSLNATYTESSQNDSALGGASDTDSAIYSLKGSMPLFSGGLKSAEIKEAIGNREAAHQMVVDLERTLMRQVNETVRNLNATRRQVLAFRQSLRSVELLLASTELGFEVGQRTAGDVLSAQQRLFAAQTSHAHVQYQYLMQLLGLSFTVGSLSVQELALVDKILSSSHPN